MKCAQVIEQLGAWVDGELDSELASSVEGHLRQCGECMALAEQFRHLDHELTKRFDSLGAAGSRVADRVVNQLPLQDRVSSRTEPVKWRNGWGLVAATAAGFLLAFFTLPRRPLDSQHAPRPDRADGHFASVSLATGPFQVAPMAAVEFAQLDSHLLEVGTKLRTGSHKSELLTPAGTILRLDEHTELCVPAADQVILEAGRLMCKTENASSDLTIQNRGATIQVVQGSCDIRCVDSKESEVIALDGDVQVTGTGWQEKIDAGSKVRLAEGQIVSEHKVADSVIETRWIHELLQQKPSDNDELQQRVDRLWASLGFSKMQNLYEEELRALGPSCVVPLTSFLASDDEVHRTDYRRGLAAALVADVADYRSISRLIQLLGDRDLNVGFHMARALARITGQRMVVPPDQWKTASPDERKAAVQKWREWLSRREGKRDSI